MSIHKPQDHVLSWALPFLPAAIAFVLLCILLVSSERMLAEQIRWHAGAHVEQSSRLFAAQLSRMLAPGAASTDSRSGATRADLLPGVTSRDAAPFNETDVESLRQHILGPEDQRRRVHLAVVDAEGRALMGTAPEIGDSEWRNLLASAEGTPHLVMDQNGDTHLLSRVSGTTGAPATGGAWHAICSQPVEAALTTLYPFRRNLLLWGAGIALLLGFGGWGLSYHLVLRQRVNRERVRDQQALLQAALNSAGDAIVSVDPAGHITQFNPAAGRMFGHPVAAMLGQPLEVLLPNTPTPESLQRMAHAPPGTGVIGKGRVTGVRADGQALELEAAVSQMTVLDATRVTAILRDVTERVRSERALAQQQQALSELTHRLLLQEKQTTRKLALALHDQLGQTLGAMRLSFDALLNMIPDPMAPKLKDRSRVLGQLIDTANAQVRQALVALRPPLLDEEGLQAALRHEVHARAIDAEPVVLQLDVAAQVAELRWPPDVEHAAFMVAREAMANALLHAGASRVVVSVQGTEERLHLSVTDDGVGLNPDMAAGRPGHLGIVGMRERALAIGAQLQAHRLIGGGTLVALTWEASAHALSSPRHTQDNDCATPPRHE
ncbi:PAS domain-containing sensor histidine kinase [Hydrogenophaga sp.]|uniref:sensor histidine kinase n=1 Tax=Hydrogenophaga sp. TaxID=1904254 RepID=UPI00271A3E57|nr:PAS domain-containing sensor histidine kinase [Hydrogenophaga sp.]MDO9437877.1 PAS domain-containing sensor histidine kinase [Hydrogenophaga sp.]